MRRVSSLLGISHNSVWKILKLKGIRAFKKPKAQMISIEDKNNRLDFCNWLIEAELENPSILNDILFTDEAVFYLHGNVNPRLNFYWCTNRSNVPTENRYQYNPRVMVWCGMHNGRLLGPYFFESTVNGKSFHDITNI